MPVESGTPRYERPGPIENACLLQAENSMLLKANLIEHHDFEALPAEVWRFALAWYQADWRIVRFLRRDVAAANSTVYLDLLPNEGDFGQTRDNHSSSTGKSQQRRQDVV